MSENEEDSFSFWSFIERYYPNYYSCNDILMSDILFKKIHNEEICEEDEVMIKDWDVKSELLKLDKMIFFKALEKYFEIHYR